MSWCMAHDFPLLDANEPEQLLAQLTYPSAVVGESELGGELLLDRAAIVAREPSCDHSLLCLELADLVLELFGFEAIDQRKFSTHACPP
jgi:hypothetical protein